MVSLFAMEFLVELKERCIGDGTELGHVTRQILHESWLWHGLLKSNKVSNYVTTTNVQKREKVSRNESKVIDFELLIWLLI